METIETTADQVEEGAFLPHLDNGYVVEVDHDPDLRGGHLGLTNIAAGMVLITFHDAEGSENYLLLWPDHPITIQREDS